MTSKKVYVPAPSGYAVVYHLLEKKHAIHSSNKLIFPMLSYLVSSISPYSFSINGQRINDKFDPSVYKILRKDDILAVQEAYLVYEK